MADVRQVARQPARMSGAAAACRRAAIDAYFIFEMQRAAAIAFT